ncbi:origin recognition complex subunit 4 protein [Rutstroemia sp. NJR-2017a WRK4]|nr:origin recognition complex subunit 4 protein [Rutstroemia sp. NJR-2017a WRK4]
MAPERLSTRKRQRSQISDEADELSPLPASTSASATKRRKVETPTSRLAGLSSRFKSLIGLGSKKNDPSADELGDEEDIYDFKVTDDENETTSTPQTTKSKPSTRKLQVQKSTPSGAAPPPKRSVGRPRKKKDGLEQVKALSRQALDKGTTATADAEHPPSSEDEVEHAGTLTKLGSSRVAKNTSNKSSPAHGTESAGKPRSHKVSSTLKRGRPKLLQEELRDSDTSLPRGILTPSKSRNQSARKTVAFEQSPVGELEGFKDIPAKSSLKKLEAKKALDTTIDQDDEDPPCQICGELDSEPPNEILFCDGCTLAVHQKCYSIPKIPDGDWFCKKCVRVRQEESEAREDTPDDGEEIACGICNGLESEPPNEIILCDNCDYSVHLKCDGIPKKPRGKWFCKKCIKEVDDGPKHAVAVNELPDIQGFEEHLRYMQRILLDRLTGQRRIKLRGHDEEMQKVLQVVEQTVLAGEGNSMLIIGARGSGKTTLVETAISNVAKDHRENFHVVRLNGFVHTDDRLALREIWRQLGREMDNEDDPSGKVNNYADTLASLLALLSHPSEISEVESGHAAKSVIFILDEFDRFTTHSRQTLLYNLFDIAQARKAPIAVLGLTTRVDVVESLEKRVKSRFSHRYVHLSLPQSLHAFWGICKEGLLVQSDDYKDEGFNLALLGQQDFLKFWETLIEGLYNNDTVFKQHLQSFFYRSKSVPAFFTSCVLPVASLSTQNFPLRGHSFNLSSNTLAAPDSKLHILQGLSDLELAMLIAAARLDIILDTDTCNFAMAYDEYSSLTSRHKIQTSSTGVTALGGSAKVWGREVALGAWERLVDCDVLIPAAIGAAQVGGLAGRMWKVDVALEEIPGCVDSLPGIMQRWCREI